VRKVFETGRRVASDLFVALDSREPTIGVGIPVRRNGQVVYALEMSLDPRLFAGLLLDQGLPADETVLILDGQTVIIARAPDHSRWMGLPPTPDQTAQVETGPDGFGFGRSLDGQTVYRAFVRSKATGWTTVVGRSQAAIQASTSRSILLLVGGAAVALLLGIGAAVVIGKRISTPISALATSAPMITRGDRVTVDASGVREVQALHDALVTAAEALRESAAERERRLIAEARAVALGDSAARLQAADRTKDEFLALLSHELRSPLNAIAGWASILRSKTGDVAMASRAIETIERNTQLLTKLVNDLLDVSRIVAGRIQIEPERVEVVPLVEDVVESLRPDAVEKEIALQSVLDPRSGVVWADPARLSQVIGNLIGNAIKFTPRGGSVAVQVYDCASEVIIAVTDTGQGIPADFLPYAFDRFRQADLSATRQHRGLGLGLAIVRHLVEFHGGTVAAESPGEGKGARFTVRLPRLTDSDQGVPG
jgi:signal transduction histidine kinase